MTIALTSPITGAAQTGFTAPTYTNSSDTPPSINSKQWVVTALGGTQVGVNYSSTSSPFTMMFARPARFTPVGNLNSNGVLVGNGTNDWATVFRKGMVPLAGQQPQLAQIVTKYKIPAGADTASPAEIRGLLSAYIGALTQLSAALGDSFVSGTL